VIFHTTVTIGYNAPWRQVHELLISAALATEGVLPEPAPFVVQTALNDFYVAYELNAYTVNPKNMQNIYSSLHQNIQDKFNEAGVEINSPHYTSLRDGNRTTIPDSYLPSNYRNPVFEVQEVNGLQMSPTGVKHLWDKQSRAPRQRCPAGHGMPKASSVAASLRDRSPQIRPPRHSMLRTRK
jgi:hypothetical protein